MSRSVTHILAQMQRWTNAARWGENSDAVLLKRYVHQHDESAFAALVARHGNMVLRLCRHVLRDAHAAEDAFQAVFLILARKAHSLTHPDALSAWLYGVARRVALKARGKSSAIQSCAPLLAALPDPRPDPLMQLSARELLEIVDDEVQRLPAPQRSAVILCCLEGRTREESAGILGWTTGSLKGHLERGRQRLQDRLKRRGIDLSAVLAVVALSRGEAASALLLRSTVTAVLHGGIGSSAAGLAHSVLKTMFLPKLATVMTVVLTVALAASTTVAVVYRGPASAVPQDDPPVAAAPKEPVADKPPTRTDALGDPLPAGAIARLGTVRLRHGGPTTCAAFTPDGKRLVSRGDDGVRVWDTATGKQLRYRYLRVWDSATGDELQRWPLELGRPGLLTPSRDGKTLAAVMYQGQAIQLLDMTSGKPRHSADGHLAQAYLAALTPAGRTAVTVGADSKLLLWDAVAGKILHTLKGHEDGSLSAMKLAPDGRTLYTVGWDKTVRLWDLSNGEELRRFSLDREFVPSGYGALALAPDGKILAVLSQAKTIRILDATSGRELRRFEGPEEIVQSAFAADNRSLVVCSGDLRVRIWDARNGRLLRDYPLPPELRIGQPWNPAGRQTTHFGAAASPDGRLLAIANRFVNLPNPKYFLVFKDLATGQEVHRLDNLPAEISRLAFAPDGRVLAWSGRKDRTIHLVETASGGERRQLPGHAGAPVSHLAFSADGSRLISSSRNTTALVWDMRDAAAQHPATAAELQTLWTDLAAKDAARAYRAIRKLAISTTSAIPFIHQHLHPVPAVDDKRLTRLIADLDGDNFAARQRASEELAKLGETAAPAFRKALDGKPSLESRRRLEDLLDKAQRLWWDVSGERLRSLRAVEALELAGTKQAREVLKTLADGAAGTRLTEEAKAALQRSTNRDRNTSP